jgi:hypothetical protein
MIAYKFIAQGSAKLTLVGSVVATTTLCISLANIVFRLNVFANRAENALLLFSLTAVAITLLSAAVCIVTTLHIQLEWSNSGAFKPPQ